jgi:2-polyprenyl-3-methyl-5-hydroxy-6-metoxy-1,4-benzoquinol methylase
MQSGGRPEDGFVPRKAEAPSAADRTPGPGAGTQRTSCLADFYNSPGVTVASGVGRAERMLRLLAAAVELRDDRLRIVDVGCGDGMATAMVADAVGFDHVVGVDWAEHALHSARDRGVVTVRAALEGAGLPLADDSTDVVIFSEVIEHLVATDDAVREIRRVLRPRGALLLSTPNLAAWYNRALLALGVQPVFSEVSLKGIYGRPGSEVVGHLRLFTRRALAEFLADNGFRVVDIVGGPYHDVPAPLRPLDRLLCKWPSVASELLVHATKSDALTS